jgi:hypothetical protein
MFGKAELKSSEAGIDRATGGYLSATALLKAQNNITNIYGKASEQMTSAKQSGILSIEVSGILWFVSCSFDKPILSKSFNIIDSLQLLQI